MSEPTPIDYAKLLGQLRDERETAAKVLGQLDAAIAAIAPLARRVPPEQPVSEPAATAVAERRAIRFPPPPQPGAPTASTVDLYGQQILYFLREPDLCKDGCADSVVLRRAVATRLRIGPKTDPHFEGNCRNALQKLKAQGILERSGQMWALTAAATVANG